MLLGGRALFSNRSVICQSPESKLVPKDSASPLVSQNGDKIFLEFSGSSETRATETGAKRGTYHGTSRIVGGTGRFSNIRGYLVEVAKFDTHPRTGYNLGEARGEYWFEQ
jgi:hypothetical protein